MINTQGNPPPGIVIGTAIKTDGDNDSDTQEVKIEKKEIRRENINWTRNLSASYAVKNYPAFKSLTSTA